MFISPKLKECPDDLAKKCNVPGTFLTSTKPDNAHPVALDTFVTPLHKRPLLCLLRSVQILSGTTADGQPAYKTVINIASSTSPSHKCDGVSLAFACDLTKVAKRDVYLT